MRKFLSLLNVVLLVFSLIGCTEGAGNSNEEIYLTKDNLETYVNLSARARATGYNSGRYYSLELSVEITPASPNYEYIDVVATIKIAGSWTFYTTGGNDSFDESLLVSLNIGGYGDSTETIPSYFNLAMSSNVDAYYEIVSVSGYVLRV